MDKTCPPLIDNKSGDMSKNNCHWGPTIYYAHKIFRKTGISYLLIRTRTCAYKGVGNVSFSENVAYVLNEGSPDSLWVQKQELTALKLHMKMCMVKFNFSKAAISWLKTYNHEHNILRLFDTLPNSFFTRIVIISNKHGIYKLPHELPIDLRLKTQENLKTL